MALSKHIGRGEVMTRTLRLVGVTALLLAVGVPVGADYSVTDLVGAARRGDPHAVHKLLELDPGAVKATDENGYTALHWAGIRGHWRIFAELLGAGAPVNAVGGDGGTPLHWVCHHDRADVVARLLDAGADLGVHNRWGRTPLHVTARRGCAEVAALLLDRGADPNAVTLEGWTPLYVASRSGHPLVVDLLLARGSDPELADDGGRCPAEVAWSRPPAVEIAADLLDDYVGLYDLGGGVTAKVWREGGGLRIREFAPDDLTPTGRDRFCCRQEPWQVRFVRDDGGAVSRIEIDFLRRSVVGARTPSPRYVGAATCMRCHQGAEQGHQDVCWMRGRHAHAWWDLGADWALYLARLRPHYHDVTGPLEDERCLLCHVTGAQDEDALFAATFRREEGVTCEACHGPGSDYSDPEVMADRAAFLAHGGVVPDEATCRRCHRNSDRFDFGEKWPEVAHPLHEPEAAAGGS
jgi:hypothetical protein